MKILFGAISILILIHVLRIDFTEGTIPTRAEIVEQQPCQEVDGTSSIPITSIQGDTIESLFALYPEPEMSFIDRLEMFYTLNPHLERQSIVSGDKILLPIKLSTEDKCEELIP